MCLVPEGINFLPGITRQSVMQFLPEFKMLCYLEASLPHPIKTGGKRVTLKDIFLKPKILTHTHTQMLLIILGVDRCSLPLCTSPSFCQWAIVKSVDFLPDHILSVL